MPHTLATLLSAAVIGLIFSRVHPIITWVFSIVFCLYIFSMKPVPADMIAIWTAAADFAYGALMLGAPIATFFYYYRRHNSSNNNETSKKETADSQTTPKTSSATSSEQVTDSTPTDIALRLERLSQLRASGAISEEEYCSKRNQIISEI
jgi:hypothetical protein